MRPPSLLCHHGYSQRHRPPGHRFCPKRFIQLPVTMTSDVQWIISPSLRLILWFVLTALLDSTVLIASATAKTATLQVCQHILCQVNLKAADWRDPELPRWSTSFVFLFVCFFCGLEGRMWNSVRHFFNSFPLIKGFTHQQTPSLSHPY